MASPNVIIVEDDLDIAYLLQRALTQEGLNVTSQPSGAGIMDRIAKLQPRLILLDLMLPGADGLSICRTIRNAYDSHAIKIIMLTARTEEVDILAGFEAGADDFIKKPFQVKEVIARTKAVLRRTHAPFGTKKENSIIHGRIHIEDTKHEVQINGQPLDLTISEYRILRLLAAKPERVYSREQLSECIGQTTPIHLKNNASRRNIDVHIRALRKKLGEEGSYIKTLRGVGYLFSKTTEAHSRQTPHSLAQRAR